MSQGEDTTSVDLPQDILSRIERRLPRSEFETVDAYVTHVLKETLTHVEAETDDDFEPADEAQVQERLKSLGYLSE